MTPLSPTPEAAPRGQKREARGQGETAVRADCGGFASGNAALTPVNRYRHMTIEQLQEESARREGVPLIPRVKAIDKDRLQELAMMQAAALDAQRIARHRRDDEAFIAAGRDLGGYDAEIQLLLPDDTEARSKMRSSLHRQVMAERERLRQQDWINRTTNAAMAVGNLKPGHDAPAS